MSKHIGLQRLYQRTASTYEAHIIPAFGPLALDLARWIAACSAAHQTGMLFDAFDVAPSTENSVATALDLGTGTAILARYLVPHAHQVIGVDLSADMLAVARESSGDAKNLRLLHADLHHLPVRAGSVDLVSASFGLNASTPVTAFKAIARILRPYGLLILQEWGAEDPVSKAFDDTLDEFRPDEIPGMDEELRDYLDAPRPWYDHLQDAEDYYEALRKRGFSPVWVKEAPFTTVHFPDPMAFVRYKLAWASRSLPYEAMTPDARAAFHATLDSRLAPLRNTDGSLDWSPPLFRVCAVKSR